MNKIPMREIVKFLPYKLKGTSETDKDDKGLYILNVIEASTPEVLWKYTGDKPYRVARQDVIPYVRPLSDLTSKIDVGEKYYTIPIESICYDYRESLVVKWRRGHTGELENIWLDYPDGNGDYVQESSFSFKSLEMLFSLHFDVYGWIEKGVAKDINELNK